MIGLPVPSSEYFPKPFQDYSDAGFGALTNKIDSIFIEVWNDLINFRNIRRVEKMSRAFLNAFGYMLVAGILDADTDRQAAQKVYRALYQRRFNSTWFDDVKPKIDIITGSSATIFSSATESDWILLAGQATDPANYWGTMGIAIIPDTSGSAYIPDDWLMLAKLSTDPIDYSGVMGADGDLGEGLSLYDLGAYGVDLGLGIDLVGSGSESVIPGNIYIDVGISTLTTDQVTQIVQSIERSTPAYFRIYLGYQQSGSFTIYNGGIIN